MEKAKIFFLLFSLLSVQWNNNPVEAADTSEAKVTGAMQKTDNPMLAVVEDEDAKSGWSVEAKKAISKQETENKLFIYFYTRTDPKAEFELSFASKLCDVLQTNEKNRKVLPKQITDMIFPRQKGSCDFKPSERAIRATAQVNTNYEDNGEYFPKTTPFQLEARILTYLQSLDSDDSKYIFKVNFDVGGDINTK